MQAAEHTQPSATQATVMAILLAIFAYGMLGLAFYSFLHPGQFGI